MLQYMEDKDIQISCISETWFDAQKGKFTAKIKDAGYEIVHANRDDRGGVGVAIMYRKELQVKLGEYSTTRYSSFEFAQCTVQTSRTKVLLLAVCRLQEISYKTFCVEFEKEK